MFDANLFTTLINSNNVWIWVSFKSERYLEFYDSFHFWSRCVTVFSSTGRDQSSLCDTLLSVCPSVRLSVRPTARLSVRKQFLLSHLLWGYLSQRLLYSPSLLTLWCSCAPAIVIMILSPGAQKGGVAIFPIKVYVNLVIASPLRLFVSDT